MGNPRNAGWASSLAEIESAVGNCLAALDRYESAFRTVLHPVAETKPKTIEKEPLDSECDRQIERAVTAAKSVEQLLAEQEAVWRDWQKSYSAWRQSLEQSPA